MDALLAIQVARNQELQVETHRTNAVCSGSQRARAAAWLLPLLSDWPAVLNKAKVLLKPKTQD